MSRTNRLGSAMTHFFLLVFVIPLLIIPFPSMMFLMTRPFVIVTHSLSYIYSSKPPCTVSLVSSWFLLN